MIDFIGKVIFSPFLLFGYFLKFIGYFLYAMIMCMVWCIQIIINFVKFVISLFKKNYRPRYVRLSSIIEFKNNTIKKDIMKSYGKKSDFDKEADLWGLSEEDIRIAKEERMSPAEFVEAEERDDDVLDTDEWK